MDKDVQAKQSICQRLSSMIIGGVERFFYRYGHAIASHPWRFISGCLLLVAVSSLGMLRFRQEKHPLKLWIPSGSDFATDTEWLMNSFRQGYRVQSVLITAPDVLQPSVLNKLQEIHEEVIQVVSDDGFTWEDVCFRVPVVPLNLLRRKREVSKDGSDLNVVNFTDIAPDEDLDEDYEFDPSISFSPNIYCRIVNNLEMACLGNSLLDLWNYQPDLIRELTKADVMDALNVTRVSPSLGHPMDYMHLLGGVERHKLTGEILSARALLTLYMVTVNFSTVNMDETGNGAGTAEWANGPALSWEKKFLEVMENVTENEEGIEILYSSGRSYGDISESTMFQDMDKLVVGMLLMFAYVQFVLCKCNSIEIRFYLATVGLGCITLAFGVAVSICSLLGIPYGPVHTALPFLLMGIGVDDMFIVVACWNNLTEAEKQLTLPEKMGRALQHAGTSITITSLTNIIAFSVGASTVLPSLQSFCLYAATGIFMTFIFQATLFTACFVIDERRIAQSRNCLIWCYKHKDFKPNSCSQVSISSRLFHLIFSKILFTKLGKFFVVALTICITSVSIKGNLDLRQMFDPNWFLPENSHLFKFEMVKSEYYPDSGKSAGVFMGEMDYGAELGNIHNLVGRVKQEVEILKDVEDWYSGFRTYVNKHFEQNVPYKPMSESNFSLYISKFLFSPSGAKYQKNFRFYGTLECGEPAPPVLISNIDFNFRSFQGPEEYLPAMNHIKAIVREANFTTGQRFATVWGKVFANWVTDEVIDTELYRNLALACVCVMLCTLVLIVNVITCFFIFICVLLTLVNVSGLMYFWGMTIDITSCIGLQLAAGLCVDYAAHIGHTFLMCRGTREERALQTVTNIGPAVVGGGISTLLSLSVLGASKSYIFISFFKIFGLVVVFGLFHGTILLPILLSMFGPPPYRLKHSKDFEPESSNLYNLCSTDMAVNEIERPLRNGEVENPLQSPGEEVMLPNKNGQFS